MSDLHEYIVTLHNKDDLDDFYQDMETPGGNLYIPDRGVDLQLRRPISRNTHYMLTHEEADQIKNDPRVMDVTLKAFGDFKEPFYEITGNFNKSSSNNNSHTNWGLLRSTLEQTIANWGSDGTADQNTTVKINSSGKNVDVVIVDGHIDPTHPEYAVNPDGSGGSRVIQYNWFQHDVGNGTGTYLYSPLNQYGDNHGAHCAGTACGNSQGWARDSNIYNINPYAQNINGNINSVLWDYVRAFHAAKNVNPATGRKNPTICNGSYGSVARFNFGSLGPITRIIYRGSDTGDIPAGVTSQQLIDNGIYVSTGSTSPRVPFYSAADWADIQDAIADGIIVVGAAGNESFRVVNQADQDFDNIFVATFNGTPFSWFYHRGTDPSAVPGAICVGNLDALIDQRKRTSSNTGTRIDTFAPGQNILSSVNSTLDYGGVQDSRNSSYYLVKIGGTSMASPQVCGMLACLLEVYPNLTNTECLQFIQLYADSGSMRDDGEAVNDLEALQNAPNRIMVMPITRQDTGTAFPKTAYKFRPASGKAYPRPRIRRKG